jgi:hypothetical protein
MKFSNYEGKEWIIILLIYFLLYWSMGTNKENFGWQPTNVFEKLDTFHSKLIHSISLSLGLIWLDALSDLGLDSVAGLIALTVTD